MADNSLFVEHPTELTPRDFNPYSVYLNNNTTDGRLTVGKFPFMRAVNIETYEAVGDNSTDNSTFINNAIAALPATNGILYVPDGVFQCENIDLPANVTVTGPGTLKLIAGAISTDYLLNVNAGDHVTIDGLTLDGNESNQTAGDTLIKITTGAGTNEGVTIQNCIIQNTWGNAIRKASAFDHFDVTITKNKFYNVARQEGNGIIVNVQCPGIKVTHNRFRQIQALAGASHGNAMFIGEKCDYADISHNRIDDVARMGIEYWLQLIGHGTISHNIVTNTGSFGISLANAWYTSVVGNTVTEATAIAIEIAAGSNYCTVGLNTVKDIGNILTSAIAVTKSSFCSINANTIRDAGSASPHASIALYSDGSDSCSHNVVSDNIIELPAATTGVIGIRVENNAAGSDVDSNTFNNNTVIGDDSASVRGLAFIRFSGSCNGNIVNGGLFKDCAEGIDIFQADNTYINNPKFESCAVGIDTNGNSVMLHIEGTGSPENVYDGLIGSTFRRTDGGAGTTLYVKESGTAATGWAGV